MKRTYNTEELRDLIATAVYIQTECKDRDRRGISYINEVDNSMDLAIKFIEKYPTGTNWERRKYTWEERLYSFYRKNN